MPASVELRFALPPGFEHLSRADFVDLLLARVRDVEERVRAERVRSGGRVLGRKRILAQSWRDRPESNEPRRNLSPRVAARNKWSRIEALQRNRSFRDAYLESRQAFIQGARDILFPPGTYWLWRFAKVSCAPLPAFVG